MDLRQIDNIIAIEQEKSISKAAQKLYLTQSALNQQLLRLEKELGTQLFERKSHSMVPTVAGRIYLNTAHQMVDLKQETYKIIHDISGERRGEISLAYTPEQGSIMFSNVYPLFHAAYPEITFRITEARVKTMEQLLLQKEVTIACLAYFDNRKNPAVEYVDMAEEFIVLGLPATHPLAGLAGENSYKTFPTIDLTLLKEDSFALIARDSRMRDIADELFLRAGFSPDILFESASTQTVFNMVRQQICPAFFPQSYVDPDAPIVYFTVPPRYTWMRSIAYLKGSYLTKPEKHFMSLAINYVKGNQQA
ncbi:MAG: LysR family transcriptional regulator [Hungatella sp.]|nr:LysR family transcriptional regulator [Hungatella sp.]